MAKVIVGHHPELTKEDAMEVFRRHFAGKYEVHLIKSKAIVRDFGIKKGYWTAVLVRLEQKPEQTVFNFIGTPPTAMSRLLAMVFFIFSWPAANACKRMEKEIKAFIENAEEFK